MEWPSPKEERTGSFRHPNIEALSAPLWFPQVLTAKHADQLSKLARVKMHLTAFGQ